MTRTMYDSITPSAIPRDAQLVAGYTDGLYRWSASEWAMFPNAVKVTITALGYDNAVCLNLEPNGYWPSDLGVGWVRRARARGVDPSIYLNLQNHLPLVRAAFDRAGEPHPHYWGAKYDGVPVIPPGLVAKQYAAPEGSGAAHAPGHYDVSVVEDYWPGVDPVPGPAPVKEEEAMPKLLRGNEKGDIHVVTVYETGDIRKHHIGDPGVVPVYEAALGTSVVNVDQWKLDYIPEGNLADPHPTVDVQDLINGVIAGVTPALIAAVRQADTNGLDEAETIAAVKEAIRQGTGG